MDASPLLALPDELLAMVTEEAQNELWVMRWDQTPAGTKMHQGLLLLDSLDLLDATYGGIIIRKDRAPRGPIVRSMENCLDKFLPKKNQEKKA